MPLLSTTLCTPFLIRPAAASVGDPLICRSPPDAFVALRWSISDCAMLAPIFWLSKET